MNYSRRQFVKGGVTAFTFGFAAPQALCDIAFAQGVPSRNLVVVYLSGGNDSLSTIIPYRDPNYSMRRPTLAVPAGSVLQIGADGSGIELGLHPRLAGLKSIYDGGKLAILGLIEHQATRMRHAEPANHGRVRQIQTVEVDIEAGHFLVGQGFADRLGFRFFVFCLHCLERCNDQFLRID